jgi:hypothetical protein
LLSFLSSLLYRPELIKRGLRGLTLMFFNLIRENQRNPRFINYYPRMENVEKTKNLSCLSCSMLFKLFEKGLVA